MAENLQITNIPANAVRDLMVDADTGESDSRFVPADAMLTYALVANAVGIELTLRSQFRVIAPRAQVEAGGTTGVFPNMDQKGISVEVFAGEKLVFELRETAGVATTDIMGTVDLSLV